MKKFLIFALFVFPMIAVAAPSVRMLGNNTTNAASVQKITPTKTGNTATTSARVGVLRAAPKTSGGNVGAITGSNSRFPIITPAHSYNSVAAPSKDTTVVVPADVDINAITDEVTQRIENNYYNKTEVYNNDEFKEAVKNVDDPRIDAIKVGSRPVHSATLPSDYVYIWIEE